jgi:phosphoribosyl-ATP pyrophosphohydrolase
MKRDVIKELCDLIFLRRESADENSYTAYLFREGLDKILKKIGEESGETIIAAKSLEAALAAGGSPAPFADDAIADRRDDLANEVADLIYHVLVMLVERDMTWEEIESVLIRRLGKTGNLKIRSNAHECK